MKYLKKSRMLKLAKLYFDNVIGVTLCDCSYKFYKGSEWLTFYHGAYRYVVYSSKFDGYKRFSLYDDFNFEIESRLVFPSELIALGIEV